LLLVTLVSIALCEDGSEQYVLITSESLKSSFAPLVDRRVAQGMDGALITVEEIESNAEYAGVDIQERIRDCIRHHYDPSRPMYLVLAGDEHIVPVRYCQTTSDGGLVPVDLYYADMDGTRWDADGDHIYGEIGDVELAELTPELCFGRVPVCKPEEVDAYFSKIIRYETIDPNEFIDSLLLLSGAGYEFCYEGPARPPTYTDHEPVSQKEIEMTDIFWNIIQPYWQPGLLSRLFDTNTDWDTSQFGDYPVTWSNVLDTLSRGFHYIYYWQHSNSRLWTFRDEDAGYVFNLWHGYRLTNAFPSIVFARGCGTAFYDNGDADESLCEALIRNANGGAVVLFGHARSAGGSPHWDQIIRNTFQESHRRIGAAHQACLLALASQKVSNPWHQYIFLLLGDPALPLHHQHKKTLQLFSPKGNEIIQAGSDLTIRWNAGGDFAAKETVSLFYSDDDGSRWNPIPGADRLPYNGCFFVWEACPLPRGSRYRIRVTSTLTPALYAESANSFTFAELGELTIRSFPISVVQITGSINNQTDCTYSEILNTTVHLTVPEAIGERTFARWTDENGDTISEGNSLLFFFERSTAVTAEYQGDRSFYVNDSIAEDEVAAGDDAADGRSRATPMRSIRALLGKYPDLGGGDVIFVSNGVYPETLSLEGKHSGLTIEGMSAESCILEGDGENTIIHLYNTDRISIRNLTIGRGARGIYADASDLDVENCVFADNSSGALWVAGAGCQVQVDGTRFLSNTNVRGGAVSFGAVPGQLTVSNCIFEGNRATFKGGAIFLAGAATSEVTILNSTFFGNSAAFSCGAILQNENASGAKFTILNSVVWKNEAPKYAQMFLCDSAVISFSDIQGGYAGIGNMDKDPRFVREGGWVDNGTPEDAGDDFWRGGDYHLMSQAGHWDPENSVWVQDDVTSPCIDSGDPTSDWLQEREPNGERINMGCYGGTHEASMSPD
jgi:hypothetical protein